MRRARVEVTGDGGAGRARTEMRDGRLRLWHYIERMTFRDSYEEPLRAWFGSCSDVTEWVGHMVALRLSQWDSASERHVFEADGGYVALMVEPSTGATLVECPSEAAFEEAIRWASGQADRLGISLPPDAPAFWASVPLRATNMVKQLPAQPPVVDGVTARIMTEAEYGPWYEEQVVEYANEITDSGLLDAGAARERAHAQFAELLPQGVHTPRHSLLQIEANGEIVGTNWIEHSRHPRTSFVFGVDIRAECRGKS